MKNAYLAENLNFKLVAGPVDLNTAAVTGARVSMKNANRIAFLIALGTSTAATLEVTVRQHNAASAGTSKDLSASNPYYVKAGSATSFTKTEPGSAAALHTLTTQFAADGGLAVVEVLAEDLDVNNGFTHVSLDIADSAAAKLGCVIAVIMGDDGPAYSSVI